MKLWYGSVMMLKGQEVAVLPFVEWGETAEEAYAEAIKIASASKALMQGFKIDKKSAYEIKPAYIKEAAIKMGILPEGGAK